MLTINADAHPLMRRMHKPDVDLPANVDHALCAYAKPWNGGRRGLVVGSAASGVLINM